MIYALIYLAATNIAGLACMGIDKRKAVLGGRRIPEKTLFFIAVIGGAVGVFVGMFLFRHKTRHKSFSIGLPVILLLQAALVFLLIRAVE